jgi:hypothetical protein
MAKYLGNVPTAVPLTTDDIPDNIISSAKIIDGTITSSDLAPGVGSFAWQSVQTTGFTAVASNAYPCDTTSAGFTVTLPATPSAGQQVQIVDYAGTFDTNKIIIDGNGKI